MKLQELVQQRALIIDQMEALVTESEAKQRSMNEEELSRWNELDSQQKDIEKQINERKAQDELNSKKIINNIQTNNRTMTNFSELITRSGDKIENFKVRALNLTSGIDNVQVASNLSVVGYEPFYKQLGVEILPNLATSVKLPYVDAIVAAKKAAGQRYDNDKAVSTVLLQPNRYTVTETIGKELLAVGNEGALQAFLFEMVKGADRAVTKDIFDVIIAGATAVTGLTAYTTANMDTLVSAIDGEVALLMPRAEFYKAKGVKVDDGSGLFLANKMNSFAGQLWDGTPLFYSQLFAPTVATTIAAADMKHITVGEFGNEYEVIFDYYTKAPEGQVVVTVCKLADVKLRNAGAVRKASIA